MLKLYLLAQNINCGYDTYDSCVVVANTEEEARRIHPHKDYFSGEHEPWKDDFMSVWAYKPEQVEVTFLGVVDNPSYSNGDVIISSFNAG